MKHGNVLTVSSLLSILLFAIHLPDDIVRGMEPGTLSSYTGVPILVVWLYGTLVLAGRRTGYIIMLVGSFVGAVVPIVHMKGAGVGGEIARSSGGFFFIFVLLALGMTSLFSFILSVRGLWGTFSSKPSPIDTVRGDDVGGAIRNPR